MSAINCPWIKCPCQFKGTSFEGIICPICPASYQLKPETVNSVQGKPVKAEPAEKIKEIREKIVNLITRPQSLYHPHLGLQFVSISREAALEIADQIHAFFADWKLPKEVELMYNPDYLDFQKGVEATKELYKNYVQLAPDQILPVALLYGPDTQQAMLTPHDNGDGTVTKWMKVIIPKEGD